MDDSSSSITAGNSLTEAPSTAHQLRRLSPVNQSDSSSDVSIQVSEVDSRTQDPLREELAQGDTPTRRKRGRPRKTPLQIDEDKNKSRDAMRFIHVNLGRAPTDHETKKAIRSHAMFAVRRDQREQKRMMDQVSNARSEKNIQVPEVQAGAMLAAPSSHAPIESIATLPLTIDNGTLELLYEHSGSLRPSSLPTALRDQIETFRKIDWPPMQDLDFVRSARLAWIGLRNESLAGATGSIVSNLHLYQAYSQINDAIRNIDQTPVDSLCYSVALCMSAACFTRDQDVLQAHFQGFCALLAHPETMILNSAFLTIFLVRFGLVHFCTGALTIDKLRRTLLPIDVLRQQPFIDFDLPAFLHPFINSPSDPDFAADRVNTRFFVLCQQGLIPLPLYESSSILSGLQTLLAQITDSEVNSTVTKQLICHIWAGSGTLYNLQTRCLTPLEKTCRYILMIHFYLQLFPTPPLVVYRLMGPALRQMNLLDIDQMLSQCPDFLLWACLSAGSFMRPGPKRKMSQLFDRARATLKLSSYEEVVELACSQYLWGAYIDQHASDYGHEVTGILKPAIDNELPMISENTPMEDEEESDLMEVCELEMTVLSLVLAQE